MYTKKLKKLKKNFLHNALHGIINNGDTMQYDIGKNKDNKIKNIKWWLKKIFGSILLYGFYIACIVFIVKGFLYWWGERETFYLTTNEVSMITNDNYQIAMYGKTQPKKNTSYKYESTNPLVVQVDDSGVIHSVSEGEAEIIVKSKYSSKSNVLKVNVEGDSIYSVEFENDNLTLDLNEKRVVKPIVNGNSEFKADFIWKSENSRVAYVNDNGEIRGTTTGTTYVTVTVRGTKISARLKVNVTGETYLDNSSDSNNSKVGDTDAGFGDEEINSYISVVSVNTNVSKNTLVVGETINVAYSISPSNATNQQVIWGSSDEKIATVDNKGNVKALKAGVVDITIKTKDGNKTSFVTIYVKDNTQNQNTTISLNKNSTIIKTWHTEVLVAEVSPNEEIVWTSEDPSIASVMNDGQVKGFRVGETKVVASTKDGKVKATCVVKVTSDNIPIKSITLEQSSLVLAKNEKFLLKSSISPVDATNQNIFYLSSDEDIVTVDNKGNITAKDYGDATITAISDNGIKAKCEVKVTEVKVDSIILNKSIVQLYNGDNFTINASIKPSNVENQKLEYISSDTKIAEVDENGVIKAKGLGTTKIKVKATDGSGKVATLTVAVVPKIGLININKQTYKLYRKDIASYLNGASAPKHMQNFAIQNIGTNKEIIYLSGVRVSSISTKKLTNDQKISLNMSYVIKIPISQLNTTTKNRTIMWLRESGHGQSFDIESDGTIWINAYGTEPTYSEGKWWGGHVGVMRLNFKENKYNSSFAALTKLKVTDSDGNEYSGLDLSVDEDNNLLALRSGKRVFVYKLSDAQKGKLTMLYSFKVADATAYRQGNDMYGGYYYLVTGYPGKVMSVTAYNMLGEVQYIKDFYVNNASQASKLNEEAEGIKIYNNRIYVGYTYNYNGGSLFNIGVFK